MVGIIDVGGGMRGAYSAGIYDYLLKRHIDFDYCLGVSAGSANLITYLAKQQERTLRFYTKYAFRREYMGFMNFLKTGSYLNLDYIYSTLSNLGGEDPVDYAAFKASKARFIVAATDALTGDPCYFTNDHIRQNRYDVIKASCAIPIACKPYAIEGRLYFDGGVSEPIPYRKAFEDGCDRLVVILTRPRDYIRPPYKHTALAKRILKRYPGTLRSLYERHNKYNQAVDALKALEKEGKSIILAPADITGMKTLTRDKTVIEKLYKNGFDDGRKIVDFL